MYNISSQSSQPSNKKKLITHSTHFIYSIVLDIWLRTIQVPKL